MMPKATGGPSSLRSRVGLLFAIIFLVAAGRWLVQGLLGGAPLFDLLVDSRFWLVGSIGVFFLLGLAFAALRVVDPFIFLTIAIIPFFQAPDSIYGFGLFAVGAVLLLIDGRLSQHPLAKMTLLAAYVLAVVVVATLVTRSSWETASGLLLFMGGFFLFLFLAFQDKIVIFVKAGRPVVRLSKKGLTEKEIEHLLALLSGTTMKEIAWSQQVKESTIRNSLSRAYRKLGFADKTQLLQWAESHDVRP